MLLLLLVCSEFNPLLCSVPQEADNLQTVIQLRPTHVAGGGRAGRRMPEYLSPQIVTSVPSSLWTSLSTRSLMGISWVLLMSLPSSGWCNFPLLLILGCISKLWWLLSTSDTPLTSSLYQNHLMEVSMYSQ